MYKTDARLQKLYAKYNKDFFYGELPPDTVVGWNDELRCYGCTIGVEDDDTKHLFFQIHINKALKVSYEQTRLTLLHECAHVRLYPYVLHGKKFQEEMKRLAGANAFKGLW